MCVPEGDSAARSEVVEVRIPKVVGLVHIRGRFRDLLMLIGTSGYCMC